MCGLIVSFGAPVEEREFDRLLDKMQHRGPDYRSTVQNWTGAQIGHCRLSIIGLTPASHQPYVSQSGRHIIAFNGEIYNFRQLAKKHAVELRTGSDTELLVELFEKLGPPMIHELLGMFAFVIINKDTNEFFVARDRLGVKPLYVLEAEGRIVFSSEIAPLLSLKKNRTLDEFALRQYRALRGFVNGRTPYVGIEMFPSGVYQIGRKRTRYWTLSPGDSKPPGDEEVEDLLRSAIRVRTLADVKVGAFLSGGVDSAYISRIAEVGNTWSVGTPEDNEFEEALETSKIIGTSHTNLMVSHGEFLDVAREMIQLRGEPLAVPNEVLLYLLSKVAAPTNKVLLSGEGADELFLGYNRIFAWAAQAGAFNVEGFASYYGYERVNGDIELFEDAIGPFMHFGSAFRIVRAFFQTSHLQGLLRRLDNSTMLAGVEGRAPFTDHRLVELMFSNRYDSQSDGNNYKAQLRRIASRVLPPEIAYRNKVGFPVNFSKILGSLRPGEKREQKSHSYSGWFDFNLEILGAERRVN